MPIAAKGWRYVGEVRRVSIKSRSYQSAARVYQVPLSLFGKDVEWMRAVEEGGGMTAMEAVRTLCEWPEMPELSEDSAHRILAGLADAHERGKGRHP